MNVLIYQDYIHNNGVLHRALCRTFGTDHVGFCDAQDLLSGALDSGTSLFVMPGGADLYYGEKLDGAGNAAIRQWVEQGGCYLGICAGAYYGCAAIDWAAGREDAIAAPRALGFFPGTAVGPLAELMQPPADGNSWHGAAEIVYDDGSGPALDNILFYEAGPAFIPDIPPDIPGGAMPPHVRVLARYAALPGRPAAIVECDAGSGRAILCGPHPEYEGDSLRRRLYCHANASYEWEAQVAQRLADEATLTRRLWARLMARCAQPRRAAA